MRGQGAVVEIFVEIAEQVTDPHASGTGIAGADAPYEAGAKHARPDYTVAVSYIGGWDDLGAARTATLALIDRGCRFVLQNADAAGPGVFQAAGERGARTKPMTYAEFWPRYLGAHRDYLVDLDDGQQVRVIAPLQLNVPVGGAVRLNFPPDRCRALSG